MKKILIFLCISVLFLFPISSSAASVDVGTINSGALTYFEGVIDKLETGEQYFIYRSGDYSATMLHGHQLKLSGSVISGSKVNQIVYNTRGQNTGNNQYTPTIDISTLDTVEVNTSRTSIVYSSLGSWATLGNQKSNDTLSYILWSVIFIVFIIVIFKFFKNRRSYISL